jgi:multidrug efflux system membrane fusion protein
MKMNRPSLLVAAALAAATAGCSTRPEEKSEEVRPVRSIVVGVTAGSVGATYPGEIKARHESKLGFRATGKILARLVDVGAHVQRGQVLMRLDPAQELLQSAAVTAQMEAARSRAAQASTDVERTEALFKRKFASQAELDQARLALSDAQSQLKNAEAQQRIAANQRAYTELVADRPGVVTSIMAEAGQVVAAGTAVAVVAADDEREVVVSISESRVAELRNAKRMTVSLWAKPGKTYAGMLRELSPDTDSVSRTYAARIAVKDPDADVRLGMTASVFTPDVEGAQAIRLPLASIYDRDGKPTVWVVDGSTSRVQQRPVKLASAQNDSVLIADGLREGEIVVTAGVNQLHAGQKVKTAGSKS